jgi:hypothetical protein
VEQRRLSIDRLPRRFIRPWRLAACALALWVAGSPATAQAPPTEGRGHEVGWMLEPHAPVLQTTRSPEPQQAVLLAEMWETESSIRYGSDVNMGESERARREEKDQEERSCRMLENLTLEPHIKNKPSRPKPPPAPHRSHPQTAP